MNCWERFEAAARQASRESPPPIDVRGAVRRGLADAQPSVRPPGRSRPAPPRLAPWAAMSSVSAAAAALVATVALPIWNGLTDPLAGLVDVLTMVMQ